MGRRVCVTFLKKEEHRLDRPTQTRGEYFLVPVIQPVKHYLH